MAIINRALKGKVPWWAKIGAKIVLSRLPLGYAVWDKIGIFQLGRSRSPEHSLGSLRLVIEATGFDPRPGWVGLELGPGDTLLSAVAAHGYGASGCYLVDIVDFVTKDFELYQGMVRLLGDEGLRVHDLVPLSTTEEILDASNATFLADGLDSLRSIPDSSVDLAWSHSTLEHIRRDIAVDTFRELRRILRADGVSFHRGGLTDHLGGSLNNMRFSRRVWESPLMVNSGFYTNRLRYSEWIQIFQDAGFSADITKAKRWAEPPLERHKLAEEFQHLSDEDLCISSFDAVLRPA